MCPILLATSLEKIKATRVTPSSCSKDGFTAQEEAQAVARQEENRVYSYREFVLFQLCLRCVCNKQVSYLNIPAIEVFAELQQAKKLLSLSYIACLLFSRALSRKLCYIFPNWENIALWFTVEYNMEFRVTVFPLICMASRLQININFCRRMRFMFL